MDVVDPLTNASSIATALKSFSDLLSISSSYIFDIGRNNKFRLHFSQSQNNECNDTVLSSLHISQNVQNETFKKSKIVTQIIQSNQCQNQLDYAILNAQSCRNITFELHDIIIDKNLDILLLTET